jgi:molecular chaperone DnaK (HSP70)
MTVPVKKANTFTTHRNNQFAVFIEVYEGEDSHVQGCQFLGSFQLSRISPAPRGVPKIEVTFDLDTKNGLVVSARDTATGNSSSKSIMGSRLPRGEVGRLIHVSQRYDGE